MNNKISYFPLSYFINFRLGKIYILIKYINYYNAL